MVFVFELLTSAYIVYLLIASYLAYKAVPGDSRLLFIKMSALTPFLMVFFVLKGPLSSLDTPLRYNGELAATEERIESKRLEIFGGERLKPSISFWWEAISQRGLERAFQQAMKTSKRIVGFDKTVRVQH